VVVFTLISNSRLRCKAGSSCISENRMLLCESSRNYKSYQALLSQWIQWFWPRRYCLCKCFWTVQLKPDCCRQLWRVCVSSLRKNSTAISVCTNAFVHFRLTRVQKYPVCARGLEFHTWAYGCINQSGWNAFLSYK